MKMATVRLPSLVAVLLFTTNVLPSDVLAAYYPAHDFSHFQLQSRRLGNASDFGAVFLPFDGLVRRDDCDPSENTDCPGMPEAFTQSHIMVSDQFAN
jgi:hypothetical protein